MISALQKRFAEPLLDLGDVDPRLRGIFTPQSERGVARTGVTSQFLENAGEYHERYSNVEGFRTLIGSLLGGAAETGSERFILDIGSGSGNSVIPLLDLYPGAFIVATDISPQLMVILRDFLEAKPEYRGRYGLVCMDANHDPFRPGAFDLAVGAAILHHIVDPRRVLRACASALRPGGTALFIEPFELGHGVLRIAYRRFLADPRRRRRHAQGFAMLERMIVDHEARLRDKNDPIFDVLDDKWYFTRSYFESIACAPEWQECRVEAINCGVSPMVDHAKMELRLGLGADESALPEWAWKTIREHEKSFSSDARRDLIFEGAVTLRRGATGRITPAEEPRDGWWWNPAEPGRGFFIEFHAGSARAARRARMDDRARRRPGSFRVPAAGAPRGRRIAARAPARRSRERCAHRLVDRRRGALRRVDRRRRARRSTDGGAPRVRRMAPGGRVGLRHARLRGRLAALQRGTDFIGHASPGPTRAAWWRSCPMGGGESSGASERPRPPLRTCARWRSVRAEEGSRGRSNPAAA